MNRAAAILRESPCVECTRAYTARAECFGVETTRVCAETTCSIRAGPEAEGHRADMRQVGAVDRDPGAADPPPRWADIDVITGAGSG